MITATLSWLIGSRLGNMALAFAAATTLWAFLSVKSCMNRDAAEQAKAAKKTLEVERDKQKTKEQTRGMSDDDLADSFHK